MTFLNNGFGCSFRWQNNGCALFPNKRHETCDVPCRLLIFKKTSSQIFPAKISHVQKSLRRGAHVFSTCIILFRPFVFITWQSYDNYCMSVLFSLLCVRAGVCYYYYRIEIYTAATIRRLNTYYACYRYCARQKRTRREFYFGRQKRIDDDNNSGDGNDIGRAMNNNNVGYYKSGICNTSSK